MFVCIDSQIYHVRNQNFIFPPTLRDIEWGKCDLSRGYGIVVMIFYFGMDADYLGIYSNMQTYY